MRINHLFTLFEKGVPTECWLWHGYMDRNGYGKYGSRWAHRAVYEALVGPIPSGLTLDHLCRNPPCVNPHHLEPVTMAENGRRGMSGPAINARKTHCIHGHRFAGDNLYIRKDNGRRMCRECNIQRCRNRRERISADAAARLRREQAS